ncbi:MAG: hypothetical protein QOH39_1611 [Verrucomicrobiota bacterium]|jgi:hypothetical protein
MTTIPAPQSGVYTLGEPLRNDAPVAAVYTPPPNEAAREELLLQKLGARGWGRMHHFRYFYRPEWGASNCRPLSPRATEAFYRFVNCLELPANCVPSLFLTDDGGLELRWEKNGTDVQVEFSPTAIELYLSDRAAESCFAHTDASRLGRELSQR